MDMMGLPLSALATEHGVPREHVVTLARWFGAEFPDEVDGPSAAIRWALERLPWRQTQPLLRKWFASAVAQSIDLGDQRIEAVMDCLVPEPDFGAVLNAQVQALAIAQEYARQRGLDDPHAWFQEIVRMSAVDPTLRMWAVTLPLTQAAGAAAQHRDEDMVDGAAAAVYCFVQSPSEHVDQEVLVDRIVCDLVAALVAFVNTWAGSWLINS
jgi:hypothetical protein